MGLRKNLVMQRLCVSKFLIDHFDLLQQQTQCNSTSEV